MSIFTPPLCVSNLKAEQDKFNLTWYIGVTLLIFLTLLTVLYANQNTDNLVVSIGGVIIALISLSTLFITGKHWAVAIIVVIFGSSLLQYSVYTLVNPDRIIDTLWISIYTLFAFYLLNKFWGLFILISNAVGLALHQVILGPDHLFYRPIAGLGLNDQIDYYVNIAFATIAISFLLLKILKTNKS